jgi:hypothetical protein
VLTRSFPGPLLNGIKTIEPAGRCSRHPAICAITVDITWLAGIQGLQPVSPDNAS